MNTKGHWAWARDPTFNGGKGGEHIFGEKSATISSVLAKSVVSPLFTLWLERYCDVKY